MGDEKRVGVLRGGREDKTEEMESYIELREGMCRGGVGGGVRTNGRVGERKAVREWR